MVSIPIVKVQITDVIETYGNNIIVITTSFSPDDEWGEPVVDTTTTRIIKAVSDSNFIKRFNFGNYGKLDGAELQLITLGDETFDTDVDTIEFNGTTYNILSVEQYTVSDIVLAQSLILGSK